MGNMPVTDSARYCSRGSKVDQFAMSTRKDLKGFLKEGPTSSGTGTSHSKEGQYKKAVQLARPKSKRAPAKLRDKFWNCQPISTRNRQAPLSTRNRQAPLSTRNRQAPLSTRNRRAPLIDAATAPTPVVIDADEDVACIKREQPPVDAARLASECGERVLNSGDDVQSALPYDSDSELTDVDDMPETTLEEELLKEVGLSVTDEP